MQSGQWLKRKVHGQFLGVCCCLTYTNSLLPAIKRVVNWWWARNYILHSVYDLELCLGSIFFSFHEPTWQVILPEDKWNQFVNFEWIKPILLTRKLKKKESGDFHNKWARESKWKKAAKRNRGKMKRDGWDDFSSVPIINDIIKCVCAQRSSTSESEEHIVLAIAPTSTWMHLCVIFVACRLICDCVVCVCACARVYFFSVSR